MKEEETWHDEVLKYAGAFNPDDRDFEKLDSMLLKHQPKKLYRYRRGAEAHLEYFDSLLERFSLPVDYNDPYDTFYSYDEEYVKIVVSNSVLFEKFSIHPSFKAFFDLDLVGLDRGYLHDQFREILKRCQDVGEVSPMFEELVLESERVFSQIDAGDIISECIEEFRKNLLICSFSDSFSNLLMWGHYANGHRGYCLEYDEESFEDLGAIVLPVVYKEHPVDITQRMARYLSGIEDDHYYGLSSLMVKERSWHYENEWRLIVPNTEGAPHANFVMQPSRAFAGCKIERNTLASIEGTCRQYGIPLFQLEHKKMGFGLDISHQIC